MIPTLTGLSLTNLSSVFTLVISSIFIQPAAALACGALARLGVLNPFLALGIIVATDVVMDCVWYVLGRHHGERTWGFFSKWLGIGEAEVTRVTNAFHAHPAKIIISSKLLGGLGVMPAILFTAGTAGMNFRTYMILNISGEILWSSVLVATGYFFSHWYLEIGDAIGKASLIACFVILLGCTIWIGRLVRARIIDDTQDSENA